MSGETQRGDHNLNVCPGHVQGGYFIRERGFTQFISDGPTREKVGRSTGVLTVYGRAKQTGMDL